MRQSLLCVLAILLISPSLPRLAAAAGPTAAVTVAPAPEGLGEIFSPGIRLVANLLQDYVEEEFLVSGEADVYTYTSDPAVPGQKAVADADVPYTTRIIVQRPASAADFNGTVVVEWWNSTATFDTAPVWDASAEYFAREGIVYVGVTNATSSFTHLAGGCSLFGILPPTCGTRYATLEMSDNGQAYEMVSQIANVLKNGPNSPLPAGFVVQRLFHAGQSQQGGSMVTYASEFHFPENDGYFVQAAGRARRIKDGPACGAGGSPPFPDCIPRKQGADRLVRTDLAVPVYRAQTETDMAGVIAGDSRQADTAKFRYYEMPGTAHVTVHKNIEVIPAGLFGPDPVTLEDACLHTLNTLADGPVFGSFLYNAMWENMERQVRFGAAPPHGDLIEVVGDEIARDVYGNALGGIRLPQLDVPVATYGPSNEASPSLPEALQAILGNMFCRLSGTVAPFDQATLDSLYANRGEIVKRLKAKADELMAARFLLPEDAPNLLSFEIDHYKCYKAKDLKNPKFASTTVGLVDQFGANDGAFEVKKPFLMCNPVDKNGSGIRNLTDRLTCYKIKGRKLDKDDRPQLEVVNQLGTVQLEAKKPFLLCVPSAKTVLP